MRTLKLALSVCVALTLLAVHLQAQSPAGVIGKITTSPQFVTDTSQTSKPFIIPVGPDSSGKYTVYFTLETDDNTFTVTGTFANADSSVGSSFTETDSGSDKTFTKTVTYPASAGGMMNTVTISVASSMDDRTTCTACNSKPHYGILNPTVNLCSVGNRSMTGLIYSLASFVSSAEQIKHLDFSSAFSPVVAHKATIYKYNVNLLMPKTAKVNEGPAINQAK
jgi:hypothetical protein